VFNRIPASRPAGVADACQLVIAANRALNLRAHPMNIPAHLSRREFVQRAAFAATAIAAGPAGAAKQAEPRFTIIAFSKPFAHLNFEETADFVADIGWDGIECPVRSKAGHIAPEKVEDDLPRMVEALKKRGKAVTMITTEITRIDPLAERVLRTAAKLGIRKYRFGFSKYTKDKPIPDTLREQGAALRDLAALNGELGIQGGWQNHSGSDYVGAPIWDVWTMIRDLDPKHIGICFDIGHAALEGGLSWPIQARLMEPFFVAVYLKDFAWEKTNKGWGPSWCNFGEGAVPRSFLANLKKSAFAGPLSQHHEYKTLGTGKEMIANMKKDLVTIREWIA
jgi:sugar phosphate isomerase/epimerase